MPTTFSKHTSKELLAELNAIKNRLYFIPEKADFQRLAEIFLEYGDRGQRHAQIYIVLEPQSDIGKRFLAAYTAAREIYPILPKTIVWKGREVLILRKAG